MKNIVIDTCVFIHIVRDTITGKNALKNLKSMMKQPISLFLLLPRQNWNPLLDKTVGARLKLKN